MEEISQVRQERDRLARLVVAQSEGRPDPKRVCRREDFVPICDEEMHEWLGPSHSRGGEIIHTHGASYARVAAPLHRCRPPMRTW